MGRRGSFLLLLACFVLSGMAGLVYQTAWTQEFALVFGTSELAVATLLAAYMGGLMAGAAVAGRWVRRIRRPVLVYALLELGIALSALLVPLALAGASRLHVLVLGGLEVPPEAGSLGSALFYLVASFLILALPTAAMGATLPILARHAVTSDTELGGRIGLLYTANTLGAAVGVLAAAFLLLPALGLGGTVWVAVGLNFLVFLLALLLARLDAAASPAPLEAQREKEAGSASAKARRLPPILPLVLASGAVSFTWEVLWTRLLGQILGGSIYAFGTMLATFLLGIALGSAAASRLAKDSRTARRGFSLAQLGIAGASLGAFLAVDYLPGWIAGAGVEAGAYLPGGSALAALALLPGAFFIGATFPFAVRILAGGAAEAGPASARVYAWNTLGAIVGAVGTGFFLLPALRIAGTATLAVAGSLLLALGAELSGRPRSRARLGLAAAGLAAILLFPPPTPWRVLRTSPLTGRPIEGEVVFYETGRSATVLLVEQEGQWRLTTNGLPESAVPEPGGRQGRVTLTRWLSLLPLASRPEAESMLIVGLGAGLTLEAVPEPVQEIHLVELEPEVLAANRALSAERPIDPLADPRLRVHLHDARSALALTGRRFDAIVSQPSHPWTAGASHLFTREFFALAGEHLGPRGVFVQWIGLRFVDEELLRSLLATLHSVFPHVELYEPFPGGGLLMLAGFEPLAVEENAARGLAAAPEKWLSMGIRVPEDLLVARLLASEGSRAVAAGATLASDRRNLLQIRSPKVLGDPLGSRGARAALGAHDPLLGANPEAAPLYYVRRLLQQRALERARQVAGGLEDPLDRQSAEAILEVASGRRQQGERRLERLALQAGSGSEAAHALLLLRRDEVLAGGTAPELDRLWREDPAARAVLEGWRQAALRNPRAVRRLEAELAAVDPRHPLFVAATRLRIAWRRASGGPALAEEALALLDPLLALGHQQGRGLLQRTGLALQAEDPERALGSLLELAAYLEQRPNPAFARAATRFLAALPEERTREPRAERIRARLEALAAG